MPTTPVSLLCRLQAGHAAADWVRFAELYTPLLLFWGRQLGMQDADAADLAQDVLARVWRDLGSYQVRPGKRFRGWLWTVTRNRHHELARKRRPEQANGDLDHQDPADPIGAMADSEYAAYLVNRALELMRSEFEESTWQACWEFVVEGRPATDVAAALGISSNAVYLSKARVLRRLRVELEGLLD